MTKQLSIKIENCGGCPYLTYRLNYSNGDIQYYCDLFPALDTKETKEGLFKYCPLPDAEEEKQNSFNWMPGTPNKVYGSEWFLAKLKDGSCSVLTALPEEYSYQYKTADETYYKKEHIIAWMQLPDSRYIPFRKSSEVGND